jgi:amino acid adenylation domain-containing protein
MGAHPPAAALPDPAAALPDPAAALPDWTGTDVVEQVRRGAGLAPDAVAVTGAGGTLTHREVLELLDRTGAAVRRAGLPAGAAVAVLAARHVALPAMLLGVLDGGARWAVLDPALPPERLRAQAEAAGVRAVLRLPGSAPPSWLTAWPVLAVDPQAGSGTGRASGARAAGEYLMFTSGTTGEPKPVLTPQWPLAHFLDWYPRAFGLDAGDRFALLGGLGHDPLLRDAFTPLRLGARLCVPDAGWLRDPPRLAAWLRAEGVTVAHLTPQLAGSLAGVPDLRLPALRLVALAGDRLTDADAAAVSRIAPRARICNCYGTTETPQIQSYHEVRDPVAGSDQPVPVGRGIPGAQLLVLDAAGQPAAVGELGDVVVHSRWLAAGYLDPELTRRRFIGTAMFRTGDRGRYRPDGAVVLAGRCDDQVKVRGYRVELGEVEAALSALPDVAAAAVVAVDGPAGSGLRAYVVAARPGADGAGLRDRLAGRLPEYAVPADVVLLPALPRNPAGKVDRAALARHRPPTAPLPAGGAEDLTTPTERLVAGVWRAVLGVPRIGATDNFFDIGGHSLAMTAVQARLVERLGRDVPIVELFRHPNVRAIASYLHDPTFPSGPDRAGRRVAARRDRRRRGGGEAQT